ncbi:MAG TPA: universal stress protein [Burkholderiales bacterium]|nr:universal stress protein [Burkholderiales bacterium]
MKTILLPFYDDPVAQHAFDAAARFVRRTNGYIEGLFVLRRPQILEGGDGDMLADTHFAEFQEECRRVADRARAHFESCAAQQGLPVENLGGSDRAAAGWREIEGSEEQVVGAHGRLFDLIVVGRDFGRGWLNWRVIVESALFDSGRPVLLTPESIGPTIGDNVVIAWNSSPEVARTIAFSMPCLQRARSVTVLSVEGWGTPEPNAKELASYLQRAGVPATARVVNPAGRTPGEVILAECTKAGADLLVKGAYTQSRLRQLIFGGATRHILTRAQLPVIFSN